MSTETTLGRHVGVLSPQTHPKFRHFQCRRANLPLDVKLASINAELTSYQTKLSKMRDGPGKTAIKQKALKVLQRRKMYEGQRDQLQQQSYNMESRRHDAGQPPKRHDDRLDAQIHQCRLKKQI
ncbi:hypothetical protein DID88_008839 [Monilinia fructigena]|uniref:Uncharacterized protein n=1 Tax=Monilinia fructigena TaxID=38457 RepID=A0A395J6L1_9HELO|nr:hypothetical protein DID88_008839 [Monilinia fructigena]